MCAILISMVVDPQNKTSILRLNKWISSQYSEQDGTNNKKKTKVIPVALIKIADIIENSNKVVLTSREAADILKNNFSQRLEKFKGKNKIEEMMTRPNIIKLIYEPLDAIGRIKYQKETETIWTNPSLLGKIFSAFISPVEHLERLINSK